MGAHAPVQFFIRKLNDPYKSILLNYLQPLQYKCEYGKNMFPICWEIFDIILPSYVLADLAISVLFILKSFLLSQDISKFQYRKNNRNFL